MAARKLYLFSTPSCGSCKQLEARLKEEHIKFKKVDCTTGDEKTLDLIDKCEVKSSVPVTVILEGSDIKYWKCGSHVDITEIKSILGGAR